MGGKKGKKPRKPLRLGDKLSFVSQRLRVSDSVGQRPEPDLLPEELATTGCECPFETWSATRETVGCLWGRPLRVHDDVLEGMILEDVIKEKKSTTPWPPRHAIRDEVPVQEARQFENHRAHTRDELMNTLQTNAVGRSAGCWMNGLPPL